MCRERTIEAPPGNTHGDQVRLHNTHVSHTATDISACHHPRRVLFSPTFDPVGHVDASEALLGIGHTTETKWHAEPSQPPPRADTVGLWARQEWTTTPQPGGETFEGGGEEMSGSSSERRRNERKREKKKKNAQTPPVVGGQSSWEMRKQVCFLLAKNPKLDGLKRRAQAQ